MVIKEITEVTSFLVETDEEGCSTYRREGASCWSQLIGESWESVFYDEELEEAFQETRGVR